MAEAGALLIRKEGTGTQKGQRLEKIISQTETEPENI